MQDIVFATNNTHKLKEVREMLEGMFNVKSLNDIDCHDDIPETANTFEGNAMLKVKYVKEHYGLDCFADDSGLECDALNGEPGVFSARYAGGDGHNSEANMDKLLKNIKEKTNRGAQFHTVVALLYKGESHTFEGIVRGKIIDEKRGGNGFGYDPIFVPEGFDKTFAEMSDEQKNSISHRGIAVRKLVDFLKKR